MWALIGLIAGYSLGALEGDTFIGVTLGLALGLALDAWRKTADLQSQLEALQLQVATLHRQLTGSSPNTAAQKPEPNEPDNATSFAAIASASTSRDAVSGTWADPQGVLTQDLAVHAVPQTAVSSVLQSSTETALPTDMARRRPQPVDSEDETARNAAAWQQQSATISSPSVLQPLFNLFRNVSPLVLAGLAVLFLGLSFLATYFAHQGLLSMELRLGFIGLCGVGLVGVGWWKRDRLGNNAALLQGAGFAVVYLTLFAACKYYPMIDSSTAFALMLLTVLAGSGLALVQQSQALAILATAGGFLVPLLTSDGSNRFVALFSYYGLLNAGVLLMAWLRQWRWLNWTGFIATFVIALSWQLLHYHSADYALVQPFFAVYFLMYLLIGYWFTLRQGHQSRGFIDGSLVFGLPLLSFSQQLLLTQHWSQGDSLSAAVYALIYAAMYGLVRRQQREDLRRFGQIQLGLALMFASLVLPFSQGASWTAFGWALEAAGLCWLGFQQQSRASRAGAYLLMTGALLAFASELPVQTGNLWLLNGDFINILVLAVSLLLLSVSHDRKPAATPLLPGENSLTLLWFGLGWLCWHLAFFAELDGHLVQPHLWQIIAAALSLGLASFLYQRWPLPTLQRFGWLLLPLLYCWYGAEFLRQLDHTSWQPVLSLTGMLALALVLFFHYRWLSRVKTPNTLYLLAMPWLVGAVVAWQARYLANSWQLDNQQMLTLFFVAVAAPMLLCLWLSVMQRWPHPAAPALFLRRLPLPWLAGLLLLWSWSLVEPATGWPLLNMPDLVMLGAVAVAGLQWRAIQSVAMPQSTAKSQFSAKLLAALAFLSATTLLVRAIQLSLQLPWQFDSLWHSSEVQLGLSVGWTLLALVLMLRGHLLAHRLRWQSGAGLLAVVLVKLFLVDLADAGSLSRIVSFITVGGLTVLIGIKAPMPKAAVATSAAN